MTIAANGRLDFRFILTTILLVATLVFWPTWTGLWTQWATDANYSHGILIVIVSIVLLYQVEPQHTTVDVTLQQVLAILLIVIGFLWLIAYFASVLVVQALFLPFLILLTIARIVGHESAMRYVFPSMFLLFAVPVWAVFTAPLQNMTIDATHLVLGMIRVPVFVRESTVFLANGTFEIEAGCSGLNYFIVALALSTLYGYLFFVRRRTQVLFIVVSALVAVALNWTRVIIIVLAGYSTDMKHYLVTVDHYAFGWVLFAIALVPIFLFGRYLQGKERRLHVTRQSSDHRQVDGVPISRFALSVVALSFVPVVGLTLDAARGEFLVADIDYPSRLDQWINVADGGDRWTPRFNGAAESRSTMYRDSTNKELEVFAAMYLRQSQGRELVNQNNFLFDRAKWIVDVANTVEVPVDGGVNIEVKSLELSNTSGRRRVIMYWYVVGDDILTDPFDVKLMELRQRIAGIPSSGILAIRTECAETCDAQSQLIVHFFRSYHQTLRDGLTVSRNRNEAT